MEAVRERMIYCSDGVTVSSAYYYIRQVYPEMERGSSDWFNDKVEESCLFWYGF